ncbi:FAD-dependent oxidoreductase [Martelella alba]|uniref:FAD-dependent oxidoreductase n=1 Tax=Martelella alba TaxID=2590451 RepID=A0A506U5Y8_9HYPH|nr:FAD-dependent oxidoreductase [Martelella alba]TPW27347.1 FAD-dependent oxidoreductase [Martelella alba]
MTMEIAVIGAGIAGLAAAGNLLQADPECRIAIFERENTAGGRLKSYNIGSNRGIVELGAGRFDPDDHRRLAGLVARFNLPTKPFDYVLSPLQNGLHDQGRQILNGLCDALEALYHDMPAQKRHAVTFESAANALLGAPSFALLVDMCGYDTFAHPDLSFEEGFGLLRHHPETNALFSGSRRRWSALADGFSALIRALEGDLAQKADIRTGHELVEIAPAANGYRLIFQTPFGERVQETRKLVLALPVSAMRRVKGLNISVSIRERIGSVPLIKAYFAYPQRWWQGLQVEGRCFTTASMFRKVYFPDDASYLMIYCDGHSAEQLRDSFLNDPHLHQAFVSVMRDALPFATPTDRVPPPIDHGHVFWPHGIAFWRSGINLVPSGCWRIGENAVICSDLFTKRPGWIEGALESAEHLAEALLSQRGTAASLVAHNDSSQQMTRTWPS